MPDLSIQLAGETVLLLPERALFWPAAATLFVADTHWGKAATFRAAGIALPGDATDADLARLDAALERTGAMRLALLGDLLHARAGRSPETLAAVAAWRTRWPALDVLLVRGNHDRHAGDPPPEWHFTSVNEPHPFGPFVLHHHPQESADGYVLAGHLHPGARLRGRGRQHLQLPCFWFGAQVGVLPAFGSFTGQAVVAPAPGDRMYVLADDQVLLIP